MGSRLDRLRQLGPFYGRKRRDKDSSEPGSPPQATPAGHDQAADQRARCAAIMGAPEAKHRPKFAEHLALKTDLSVEQAIGAMRCTPREIVSGGPGKVLNGGDDASDPEADRLAKRMLAAGHFAKTGNLPEE